jgi:hypothetical protein
VRQQGVEEAVDIRTKRQAEQGGNAARASSFNTILTGQSVVVRKNSAGAEVTRPRLNLIEGANVTITLADDPVDSEADITFALIASPNVSHLEVGGTRVIGAQEAAIADADGTLAGDTTTINDILAALRSHGLIAT